MRRLAMWLLLAPLLVACAEDLLGNAAGIVKATPESIDFGQKFVGTDTSETVTLSNAGRTSVAVRAMALPTGYDIKPAELTIAPGGRAEVKITFSPAVEGRIDGEIGLRLSGAKNAGVSIPVKGEGVKRAIDVVDVLDFGLVRVGESSTLDVPMKSLVEFQLDAVLEVGSKSGDKGNFVPSLTELSLKPGEDATMKVTFTPTHLYGHSASLAFKFCARCPEQRMELKGAGGETMIRVDPPALAFGTLVPGAEKTMKLGVENIGQFPAMVSGVKLVEVGEVPSHPDFSIVNDQAFELAVGETVDVFVLFQASAELGPRTGLIQILDEEGNAYVDVSVTGKSGGIEIVGAPPSIDFGKQPLEITTRKTVVIQNVGQPKEVRLDLPSFSGAGSQKYTLRGPDGSTTGPWMLSETPLAFEVSFGSADEGEFSADLSFQIKEQNGSGTFVTSAEQAEVVISLVGQAREMPPCLLEYRPPEVRFGAVKAGKSHNRELEIANVGTDECIMWNIALEDPATGRPAFFLPVAAPEGSFSLPAGESFKTSIRYAPPRAQTRLDETYFVFNHSNSSTARIRVSGLAAGFELVANPSPISMGTVKLQFRQYEDFYLVNQGASAVHYTVSLPM